MFGKKGISPMIAIVLLIAFTVAVGGILSLWLTTLSATQTTTTGSEAEKQILCARSVLEVTEVKAELGTTDIVNVTVVYSYGTENIYNFSITFIDNQRNSATTNGTLTPQYNDSAGQRFTPGMMTVWNVNEAMGLSLDGASLESVRVKALCQETYPVSGECKSGQACMK